MTPRAKIETLLDFWLDVELGLRDRLGDGGVIGMCRAWNHRSYRELRRLLPELRAADPLAHRHLLGRYLAPRRQVMLCPRCLAIEPASLPWKPGQIRRKRTIRAHMHGGKAIELRASSMRVEPAWLHAGIVDRGVDWLEQNFRGDPSLPQDLIAVTERVDPKRRNAPVDAVWPRSPRQVVARFGNPRSRRVA